MHGNGVSRLALLYRELKLRRAMRYYCHFQHDAVRLSQRQHLDNVAGDCSGRARRGNSDGHFTLKFNRPHDFAYNVLRISKE